MSTFKRYGFLLVFLLPLYPLLDWYGHLLGGWLTVLMVFGVLPVMDYVHGRDTRNVAPSEEAALIADPYFRYLTYACLPVLFALLVWGGWLLSHRPLTGSEALGFIVSVGISGGVLGINTAHELIHKEGVVEPTVGGLLLALVCYGGFKVEHVRGHHRHVATEEDSSSAALGQSLYDFLPRAIYRNVRNAWRLERERLHASGLPVVSWHNEVLRWHGLSAGLALGFFLTFGWSGLMLFLGQSLVAILLLESVNYIEHYGLRRERLADGRYEKTTHHHSWNSDYLLSNLFLFQLQRHSDHHAHARRRYPVLRRYPDSPQLPGGYATMLVLAAIPPLWRAIIDPRIPASASASVDPV